LRRQHPDDRQHFHPGPPAGCNRKRGVEIIVSVAPGRSHGKIHAVVDRQRMPVRLGLTAGQAHDAPVALTLLDRLKPRTIMLADKAYDAGSIRDLIKGHKAVPKTSAKSNRK